MCTDSVLGLGVCWECTGVYRVCTGGVLEMYWELLGVYWVILGVYEKCIGNVMVLFWECTAIVHELCWECTLSVRGLYLYYTGRVLEVH